MNVRNRKIRLAVALTVAIVVAFVAWRTSERASGRPPCKAERTEEKDATGKVTRITHTECIR